MCRLGVSQEKGGKMEMTWREAHILGICSICGDPIFSSMRQNMYTAKYAHTSCARLSSGTLVEWELVKKTREIP